MKALNQSSDQKDSRKALADIDLTGLKSGRGSVIRVFPRRGVKLQGVSVEIQDFLGHPLEAGPAVWDAANGNWLYMTRTDLPEESRRILVSAIRQNRICTVMAMQLPLPFPTHRVVRSEWEQN